MRFRPQGFARVVLAAAAGCAFGLAGLMSVESDAAAAPGGLTTETPNVSVGSVTLGNFHDGYNVTLQNASTSYDTIPAVFAASGSDEADFVGITQELDNAAPGCAINEDESLTMAPGARCDVLVIFAPSAVGYRSATLTIPDSLDSGLTLSVSGTGAIGYYQVRANGEVWVSGDATCTTTRTRRLCP